MTASVAIVVPCYNVGEYLDDCLRSATGQSFADLQIVVVNDGSTDETPEIVDRWAASDPRIVAIHQPNAGLGAARNRGIEAANSDFLFFLDSDDLLPFDAIERMVASAFRSGSDIVSGVADRFNTDLVWRSGMYKEPFTHDTLGTHIFVQTELLYDHIACSKLFRSSFWAGNGLEFPEGVLFEDIELVTRAHCLARTVDLLADATYLWRDRDGETKSITQDRSKPGSTAARFASLCRVDEYLRDHTPSRVWDAHGNKTFSLDVPAYASLLASAGPAYRTEFMDAVGPLADAVSPAGILEASPLHQLLWRSLIDRDADMVSDIGEILAAQREGAHVRALRQFVKLRGPNRVGLLAGEALATTRDLVAAKAPPVREGIRSVAVPLLHRSTSALSRALRRAATSEADGKDSGAALDSQLGVALLAEKAAVKVARGLRMAGSSGAKAQAGADGSPQGPVGSGLGLVGAVKVSFSTPRDESVEIRVDGAAIGIDRVMLVHESERLTVEVERSGDVFRMAMDTLTRYGDQATFRPVKWRVVGLDALQRPWALLNDGPVRFEVPDDAAGARYRLRSDEGGVVLLVASQVPTEDRPAGAQTVIRDSYRTAARSGERRRMVFYECFYGRSVGGHPRALYEELSVRLPDYEHVFAVQPGFHHPPSGAQSALRWTRRYHECLQSAPIVVSNCELHPGFERSPFQVVAQTWHGTPLKRIGLDIDSPKFHNEDYQANLAHQVAQWSFLVSPTADTDEIFPRAFGYEGPLLSVGSPRNDRVVTATAQTRAEIRKVLGLREDQPAVLFAPTFRDDSHTSNGYRASPSCDLSALTRTLPKGAVVLVRAHTNIRSNEVPWLDPSVVNVSDYPDMQDLIVGADVLLTDYSSTMFDWALTGKPLVLFAPDLDHYRGVRDFYYDYESTMPVPVATHQNDLADQLRVAVAGKSPALDDFAARFAGRDDGAAAARVADEILARLS